LSNYILAIALITGGISWIPIIEIGGVSIDVENLGRLLTIVMLPLLILKNRFKMRMDSIVVVLILWIVWTATLMHIHTGTDGIVVMRMWLVETVFVYTTLNCNIKSITSLKVISISSVFVLSILFAISSYIAGIDLLGDTLNYIITQNRPHFLHHTLKGTFNAFIPNDANFDEIKSVIMNKVAASFALYYTILLFMPKSTSSIINTLNNVAIGISVVFILILFSSSSILMFLFSTILYTKTRLRQNRLGEIILFTIIGLVFISVTIVFLGNDIVDYLFYQISSDENSREGRVLQYLGALKYIEGSPIFGVGYVTFGGLAVHNWLLFSWISGGVVSVLLSIIIYMLIAQKVLSNKNKISNSDHNFSIYYLVLALSFIFIIRTMVGGAGGVASGAGMIALSIVLLLSKRNMLIKNISSE
jgi:hypothetical protein